MAAKKTTRKSGKPKFAIFSIFGQIEAAAADHFIEHHNAYRIPVDKIPDDALRNDAGVVARFAVLIPGVHVAAFNKMCEDLRS